MSEYYKKNKSRIDKYRAEWSKKNKDLQKKYSKISYNRFKNTPSSIYKTIKGASVARKMPIKVSKKDFLLWYEKVEKKCHYCNLPEKYCEITANAINRNVRRLTIDRIDNNKAYSINNILIACYWCNQIKGRILSKKEMEIVGKLVIKSKWKEYVKKNKRRI